MKIVARLGPYTTSDSCSVDIQELITKYEPYCKQIDRKNEYLEIYTEQTQYAELLKEMEGKRLGFTHWLDVEYSKQEMERPNTW